MPPWRHTSPLSFKTLGAVCISSKVGSPDLCPPGYSQNTGEDFPWRMKSGVAYFNAEFTRTKKKKKTVGGGRGVVCKI